MPIKIKKGKQVISLDVNQKTSDPVTEVLAMLNRGHINKSYIFLDFSSLKPSKLNGDLEKLFVNLPNQPKIHYIFALPENIIHNAELLATEYNDSITEYAHKPHYSIMGKNSAMMLVNQRNR